MSSSREPATSWLPALGLGAVLSAAVATAVAFSVPPSPRGLDADPARFSAIRAEAVLERLMGDERPHPVGSSEDDRVRERIVTELEGLGLTPVLQEAFVCGSFRRTCAEVMNVFVRIEGSQRGKPAILLNAHYDTQPATPGAADCMAGVASLIEIARAVSESEPLDRDLYLLINEGEEAGLLGAEAFVEHHPLASSVGVVINLEARGSSGPSVPAYTTGGDLGLLRRYARVARDPAPGSALLALTRLLPLANDLSVFERLGVPGVTFGWARHPRRYHTPRDDLAHLSRRSVQHQGENTLRLVRRLRAGDFEATRRGSFFAIGPFALGLPASWSPAISIAGLVAVLALALLAVRGTAARDRGGLSVLSLLWGALLWPLALIVTFFAVAVVNLLRKLATALPSAVVSQPLPTFAGFCLCATGLLWLLWRGAGARLPWRAVWLGGWLVWGLLGVLVASLEARAASLFFVPLGMAALAAGVDLVRRVRGRRGGEGERAVADRWPEALVVALPAITAAALWAPHLVALVDLIGIGNLPPVATLAALPLATAAPLLAGRPKAVVSVSGGVLVVGLALVAAGTRVPTFTEDHPQFSSLLYHLSADRGEATWTVTGYPVPKSLAEAAGFGDDWRRVLAHAPQEGGATVAAPIVDLSAPELTVEAGERDGEGWTVRGHLRSLRGAPWIQLAFPVDRAPSEVWIGGVLVPADEAPYPLYDADFDVVTVWPGSGEAGTEIELRFSGSEAGPVLVLVVDRSWSLPDAGASLLAARPEWSTPVGLGDGTLVSTTVVLEPPS